ncbi:unnamed protein product [Blepharisma stoltei]|uniref:Uncharacterized protein n=1 Tax=Blepharisma stoltei TaxID=1481888 RepID=A0AAU9JTD1_9CILI|nr:unnamed protein product [Blepharisma stoltei]
MKCNRVELENGSIYIGECYKKRQRHGFGLQLFTDGSQYEGYWIKDKANIKGRLVRYNGDIFRVISALSLYSPSSSSPSSRSKSYLIIFWEFISIVQEFLIQNKLS